MIRHVRISLPLIDCLADGTHYMLPGALPALASEDLRPLMRPRIATADTQKERARSFSSRDPNYRPPPWA